MATKDELSEEVNNELGTEIDWSQLKKDDLEQFKMIIDENLLVEQLAKKVAKEKGEEKFEEMVDEWYPGKYAASKLL